LTTSTCRILLVEDNPADIELLTQALEEVAPAATISVLTSAEAGLLYVRSAVRLTRDLPFDLLLLDLYLPQGSGYDVLQALKRDPYTKHLPVLVWTGFHSVGEMSRAYSVGANAYIPKPTGWEGMVRFCRHLVGFWCGLAFLPGHARA
jgi:CheY-like chemotaxis protein